MPKRPASVDAEHEPHKTSRDVASTARRISESIMELCTARGADKTC